MPQSLWEHQQRATRLEELLGAITTCTDPNVQSLLEELVQTLMELHNEGLARLLELTQNSEQTGTTLIETFANDELLSTLFVLHGLHPMDITTRITNALNSVHDYLTAHGIHAELVNVEDNTAYLRLHTTSSGCSSNDGCASSAAAFTSTIENTLKEKVPDLTGIEIEIITSKPVSQPIPVTFVPRKQKV